MNLVTLPQELSVYQVADLKEIDFTQQPLFICLLYTSPSPRDA